MSWRAEKRFVQRGKRPLSVPCAPAGVCAHRPRRPLQHRGWRAVDLLYYTPSDELTAPAGQDGLERPALLKLFEHLSGSKSKLTSFILDCDWTDDALVVWLSRPQWLLTVEVLKRLLGLTATDANNLLGAAIAALARLPLFDEMVRSMDRKVIRFRTDVAGNSVSLRRLIEV